MNQSSHEYVLPLFKVIELRYIQNREEQVKILKACHIDPTAGHMGIKKTVHRITERFIWPGIVKDVKEMVCLTHCMLHHVIVTHECLHYCTQLHKAHRR